MKSALLSLASLCLSLAACGDSATPVVADVPVTIDRGVTVDAGSAVDAGSGVDVPATMDATRDVAVATDSPATPDLPAVVDVQVDQPVVAQDVPAGRTCGGRGGTPCPDGQFCDFPVSSICGRADGPGACTTPPEVCNGRYDPVCGCDGRTYGNACSAAAARVSVDHPGECEGAKDAGSDDDAASGDCRTRGCSSTSTCMPCRGAGGLVYACIPSGAVC